MKGVVLWGILLIILILNVNCMKIIRGNGLIKIGKINFARMIAIVSIANGAGNCYAAEQYKLPPIDFKDKNRCVLVSSSMGQANAARDKLYDLRLVSPASLTPVHQCD
jgi:hypothetical protein